MFFNRQTQKNGNQRPSEVARVTPSLAIALWQAVDRDNRTRLHFKFQRLGEDGQSYATLRPRDVLELPEAVAAAASCLAKVPNLSAELREELARVAELMEQVVTRRKANGSDPEESDDSSRILNL
jgi:hypothetical protein